METMIFRVTTEFGGYICDLEIPFYELYLLKQAIVCDVQYGQIVIY